MPVTINGTTGIAGVDGSASTPAVQGTDTNTGIFFPAADTIAFGEGGTEAMRIDSSGNVGIGSATARNLEVTRSDANTTYGSTAAQFPINVRNTDTTANNWAVIGFNQGASSYANPAFLGAQFASSSAASLVFGTSSTERARINSTGTLLIGKTTEDFSVAGVQLFGGTTNKGLTEITTSGVQPLTIRRNTNDGGLILFFQDSTQEGDISVSGTTVSYNGGHLSRYAQLTVPKDETNLLKGTVMSNLDEMNVYTDAEGNPVPNEQLNKVKVSDVESDVNVAGVFVNWSYDEAHQVDEINMAMTGDMIIRIAQGVVVQKGDLLMSAGDGTAKPQGDDIVRSKTIAKVTSNHVTCTYEDGSYCVPCVLMAC